MQIVKPVWTKRLVHWQLADVLKYMYMQVNICPQMNSRINTDSVMND